MTALIVAGISIIQDTHHRYNLNTLHQASGSADSKRPSDWVRRKTTQALIAELEKQVVDSPLDVVTGGNHAGTYAHELLAVSYAGWISPAFQLRVNQAFLDMKRGSSPKALPVSYAQMALQTAQALVEMEQRQLALEATQDTHTAQIAALQERQPPEGRMHVHQYIRAYSKPYLPASVMDSLKYHARRLETPVLWLPEGFGHEVPYYTIDTLHAAYLEATRQLSFIHDPGVTYRRLPRRGGHRA
jgi:hypothetical protein